MMISSPVIKNTILTLSLLFVSISISAQTSSSFWQKSDTLNTKRRNAVYIAETAAAAVTLIGLNQLWYANHERSSFQL